MDFDELQYAYNTLKARLDAANKVIEQLDESLQRVKNENLILLAQKDQWEQSKVLQDTIVQQSLGNSNILYQRQAEEIQELKDRLRKYEGDID